MTPDMEAAEAPAAPTSRRGPYVSLAEPLAATAAARSVPLLLPHLAGQQQRRRACALGLCATLGVACLATAAICGGAASAQLRDLSATEQAWSIWHPFNFGPEPTTTSTKTSTTRTSTTRTTTTAEATTVEATTAAPEPEETTTEAPETTTTEEVTPEPTTTVGLPSTTMTSLREKNPYSYPIWYVNPANQDKYAPSIESSEGEVQATLKKMAAVPTAVWITEKKYIRGNNTGTLQGALRDSASKQTPELVTVIWYDLPNRDCDAKASVGEFCCTARDDGTCDFDTESDCAEGIEAYKTKFVDEMIAVLQEFEGRVPVVVIVEPDSLPNLATNLEHPHCGNPATQAAYKQGIKYAIHSLIEKTTASVYIDGANGAWLGWAQHMKTFMNILKDLELPMDKVRGFSTNVAKYIPLGQTCPWEEDEPYRNSYCLNNQHQEDPCCADPLKLLPQYTASNNELNYVNGLRHAAKGELGLDMHFVIDTSRNGVENMGNSYANWCNLRGAGAGIAASLETADTEYIDAYFWMKCPGESDGCTEELPDGTQCGYRFDPNCKEEDSIGAQDGEPRAPQAGQWFDYQVKQLAENANMGDSVKIHM